MAFPSPDDGPQARVDGGAAPDREVRREGGGEERGAAGGLVQAQGGTPGASQGCRMAERKQLISQL